MNSQTKSQSNNIREGRTIEDLVWKLVQEEFKNYGEGFLWERVEKQLSEKMKISLSEANFTTIHWSIHTKHRDEHEAMRSKYFI